MFRNMKYAYLFPFLTLPSGIFHIRPVHSDVTLLFLLRKSLFCKNHKASMKHQQTWILIIINHRQAPCAVLSRCTRAYHKTSAFTNFILEVLKLHCTFSQKMTNFSVDIAGFLFCNFLLLESHAFECFSRSKATYGSLDSSLETYPKCESCKGKSSNLVKRKEGALCMH